MNILFISNLYTYKGSSAAIRNNSLVKGLISLGHTVDVLTVRYSETSTSRDLNCGNIIFTELFNQTLRSNIKKVVNNGMKNFLADTYSKVMNVIHFPRYYNWPDKVDVESLGVYDLMISSSDDKISHFVGRKVKKARPALKWIQIWGDPWLSDVNSSIWDKIRIKHYEKVILEAADEVVYISLPTAEMIKSHFPQFADKIHFVPRSYYEKSIYTVSNDKDLHIVYTGTIISVFGRSLSSLVRVVEDYNKTSDQKVYIDVYGRVDNEARKDMMSDYVKLYDGVDVSELKTIYHTANALLFVSNKAGSTQIPGKLYDYLGTSSAILCLVNNKNDGIANFLQTLGNKCFLVENNESALSKSFYTIIDWMKKEYEPDDNYSPEMIAAKVLSLC